MTRKQFIVAGVVIAVLVVVLGCMALVNAGLLDALRFYGTFTLGEEVYEFTGQAALIGTVTPPVVPATGTPPAPPEPTDAPEQPPTDTPNPADTPAPTDTPDVPGTPKPPAPTDTADAPGTPKPPASTDYDIGTHGWDYALEMMATYPQDNALISVLVPSMMRAQGYTYADLVQAAGYAGPHDSKIDSVRGYAANAAGANVVGYVPEGNRTSARVPVSETIQLEYFLAEFVAIGQQHGLTLNYGPSLELISDPDTWIYHRHYDLDVARVTALAAMLPDNSFWSLRVNTPEHMYADDPVGFRGAIQEIVDAIHAGNPTTRIILHLSLPPDMVDQFMFYVTATEGIVDQYYAGIDYPFPSDPNYDPEGTLAALEQVLLLTGAVPIAPAATPPAPPTAIPAPPGGTIIYDVSYAGGDRHVFDLYLPAGDGPFPVVAWFHGGGMNSGNKSWVQDQCGHVQAAGMACAAPNYTLTPNEWLPVQIHEAKAVVRAIKALAAQYNLDPNKVGVAGGSAGGILSVAVGTSNGEGYLEGDIGPYLAESSDVSCFLANAGVYDLSGFQDGQGLYSARLTFCEGKPIGNQHCQETQFFNCDMADQGCRDRIDQAGGYHWISPGDPPGALVVGDQDETPNWQEDHESFHATMLAAGNDSTLTILPDVGHNELWPDNWPYIRDHFWSCLNVE